MNGWFMNGLIGPNGLFAGNWNGLFQKFVCHGLKLVNVLNVIKGLLNGFALNGLLSVLSGLLNVLNGLLNVLNVLNGLLTNGLLKLLNVLNGLLLNVLNGLLLNVLNGLLLNVLNGLLLKLPPAPPR